MERADRVAHADVEGVLAGTDAEGESAPAEEHLARVARELLGASPPCEVAVPEVEVQRLALARELVVEEVDLQRAVGAEHLQRAARKGLAERHVELRRAAFRDESRGPTVVEHLPRVQLTGAELRGARTAHGAKEVLQLAERVHGLLEDDVARRAEHPVRVVAGVELAQRHGEGHLHVLDAADLAGAYPSHQALEGRVEDVVVVDAEGQPTLVRELREGLRVRRRERDRLLDEDTDPELQELPCELHVQVRRHREVRDLDPETGQVCDPCDGVFRAELLGGGFRAGNAHVADRRQFDVRRAA
jgi:hypothetical protein